MDKLEQLIKALEEAKTELSKNMNQMYDASQPNMVKEEAEKADYIRPDAGYGKVTVKDATPKPSSNPEKPYGRVILKEELHCAENGQWSLMEKDASNPKLAPKDRKVKQLQQQIDAGTYKPDAGKIAGAMLSHPEKPLKKEECHPDDPKHEEKEQAKAKKIKEHAEDILDLHKK